MEANIGLEALDRAPGTFRKLYNNAKGRVDNKKLKFRKSIFSQSWHVYLTDSRLSPS